MKKFLFILLAALFIFSGCGAANTVDEPKELSAEQAALKDKYPEYFGLDESAGLDVIVLQHPDGFRFGLLTHYDGERDWFSKELLNLRGTTAEQMKTILSSYEIDKLSVCIIPYQNPMSSYIGDFWTANDGENLEAKQAAYINQIREMLFS